MRRLLLALAWLAALLLLAQAFRNVGEHWPATAVMLYWPPAVWLLPGPPSLAIALLRFDFKMLLALAAAAVVWLHRLGGYRPPCSQCQARRWRAAARHLAHEQHRRAGQGQPAPFKDRIQPDFLLLQDAPSRARRYRAAPGYEEFPHAEDIGEFTLVSKHPIVRQGIDHPATHDNPAHDAPPASRPF